MALSPHFANFDSLKKFIKNVAGEADFSLTGTQLEEVTMNVWKNKNTSIFQNDGAMHRYIARELKPYARVEGEALALASALKGGSGAAHGIEETLRRDALGVLGRRGEDIAHAAGGVKGAIAHVSEGVTSRFARAGKWALGGAAIAGAGLLAVHLFSGSKKPSTPQGEAIDELNQERAQREEAFAPEMVAAAQPNTMMGLQPTPADFAAKVRGNGGESKAAAPKMTAASFEDALEAASKRGGEVQAGVMPA